MTKIKQALRRAAQNIRGHYGPLVVTRGNIFPQKCIELFFISFHFNIGFGSFLFTFRAFTIFVVVVLCVEMSTSQQYRKLAFNVKVL